MMKSYTDIWARAGDNFEAVESLKKYPDSCAAEEARDKGLITEETAQNFKEVWDYKNRPTFLERIFG